MEHKFEVAKNVIEIVSTYNGSVYGSFVRDVIVPRMDDPKCEISFDKINVWLQNSFSRNCVIEKLRENFKYETDNENYLTKYKILDDNDKLLFKIKFIVTQYHPAENFDVNFVRFRYSNGLFQCIAFEHLIDKIKNKQAKIVKTYIPTKNVEFEKINKDFFQKGWTVSSKEKQTQLSKWIVQNNIHVLISYENEHWNYYPTKINNNDESEYKIDIAKKILTLASIYNGEVYGGFVRDVIVPRINDPNCDALFKDIDIWFHNEKCSLGFTEVLQYIFKIEKVSFLDRDVDYSKTSNDLKFSRRQYRIYSQNGDKFLFHIDVITSDKLPVNDFNVNTITYKYINDEFIKSDGCDSRFISNKIATMIEDYNPESPKYYERINRIFFSKGWTIRCYYKHFRLSEFIKKNKLNVEVIYDGVFYDYIPKNTSKFDPAIKNRIKITPFLDTLTEDDKLDDKPKEDDKSKSDDKVKFDDDKLKEDDKQKEDDKKIELNEDAKKIELILSSDSIEKRNKNRSFISVSEIKRFPCRYLSGAVRSWSKWDIKENTRVFILHLRITGTPEHIKETLRLAQYTEEEINNYLKDAITKDNYQTTKNKEYKKEIADFKKIKSERNEQLERILINNSKDDSKDIMKSIFDLGLGALEEQAFNNIKDEKLRYIYKIGLDEYRKKFNYSLKEM